MKSIKELVAQYGSQQRLADAMGVHRPQVSRWVKLNAHIDENGDVYIKTRSVNPVDGVTSEWKEIAAKALAVLQVNGIPLIGDYPERCLREIEAKAGRAGFVACAKEYGVARLNGSEQSVKKHADLYALSIKYEVSEPMLRAAFNWIDRNKSKKPQFSMAVGIVFNDNDAADEFDCYMDEIANDYHIHISPRDVVRLFVVADQYAERVKRGEQ